MTARDMAGDPSAIDREWFKSHPDRSHRLRPAMPDEIEGGTWVVTRQVAPGIRVRVAFTPPSPPPLDDEALAHVIFDLIAEHHDAGQRFIPMTVIHERWHLMMRGGRA